MTIAAIAVGSETVHAAVPGTPSSSEIETIVLMRHGEKPRMGFGQLNCQGLNRSLALPRVLEAKFGKPDAIFAPDPSIEKADAGTRYAYVRPLATIEPTAIYFGLPLNVSLGFAQHDELRGALSAAKYRQATIFVAGEHHMLETIAREFLSDGGGDPAEVPRWEGSDFDSLYVLRMTRQGGKTSVAFRVDSEGLNARPTTCPAL